MGANDEREDASVVYKTKVVQFLGRSIPIILQNDNGPCPLLAICNVLLLRNIISLSLDTTEISLQRLLTLVAERLLDSNSNVENKDAGYVQNQQQNIADSIDLLPRLATGIDVNIRFRNIHDFEFTPECAIFDLLDIGLVHGWIFDPQDEDTSRVIGSSSYNTLMEKLVALDASKTQELNGRDLEEDCVDFHAATTATLGVPSPSLSRGISFDGTPVSTSNNQRGRKGDEEEVQDLLKALDLSKTDFLADGPVDANEINLSVISHQNVNSESPAFQTSQDSSGGHPENENQGHSSEVQKLDDYKAIGIESRVACPLSPLNCSSELGDSRGSRIDENHATRPCIEVVESDHHTSESLKGETTDEATDLNPNFLFPQSSNISTQVDSHLNSLEGNSDCQHVMLSSFEESNTAQGKPAESPREHENVMYASTFSQWGLSSSDGKRELIDSSEDVSSSLEGSEPIYEGEECILLDSEHSMFENREPLYEGEVVLAEQADRGAGMQDNGIRSEDETVPQEQEESLNAADGEGKLIRQFFRRNASQLTVYGLFCLQEGLKERELCVFFRNNHFSTLFKFNGDLYLLATDQGYINQPDLVWEKLNEVHGDSVFMTGNFKVFKADDQVSSAWNEHHAVASTADYIASVANEQPSNAIFNSDLQLAIALQQQEFEQQQQQHRQQPQTPQSSVSVNSRMVTSSEVPKPSSSTPKQEAKSKEKCVVM